VQGLAYLAAGFLEKAADCFTAATKLAPDFADAWVNLGVARYRSGKILPAGEAMRAALRADPGNAAAAGNLGAFLRLTGEIEAAETVLREVIAANPAAATARINFAADPLREDRAAEALELLDGASPDAGAMRSMTSARCASGLLPPAPQKAPQRVIRYQILRPYIYRGA
jgi:Flp pilus assembly protein TadD